MKDNSFKSYANYVNKSSNRGAKYPILVKTNKNFSWFDRHLLQTFTPFDAKPILNYFEDDLINNTNRSRKYE